MLQSVVGVFSSPPQKNCDKLATFRAATLPSPYFSRETNATLTAGGSGYWIKWMNEWMNTWMNVLWFTMTMTHSRLTIKQLNDHGVSSKKKTIRINTCDTSQYNCERDYLVSDQYQNPQH